MHLLLCFLITINSYKFNRLFLLPEGPDRYIFTGDTDHNGLDELIFNGVYSWKIWEYKPINRFEKVYEHPAYPASDTSFAVRDIGDGDKDGLSELLVKFYVSKNNRLITGTAIFESENYHSFPSLLVYSDTTYAGRKFIDLDSDGKIDIWSCIGIWENEGDNTYSQAYEMECVGYAPVFGDFDGDGKMEWFKVAIGDWERDSVAIWECTGDNNYEVIWGDQGKGTSVYDYWVGNDTDGDGKPEIFLKTYRPIILSMYETTGNNSYEYKTVGSLPDTSACTRCSACGDVDGDGIEEIVIGAGRKLIVYKAMGNDEYKVVGEWKSDIGYPPHLVYVRCHDFNKNGYDEIIACTGAEISILEIDTTASGISSNLPISKSFNLTVSPNPADRMVDMRYEILDRGPVSLNIYDASGRLVRNLARIQSQKPRAYTVAWNGDDNIGNPLPSGIYFCKLRQGDKRIVEKIVLTRR